MHRLRYLLVVVSTLPLVAAACPAEDGTTPTSAGPGESRQVDVFFVDQEAFNEGAAPFVRAVQRTVDEEPPHQATVDALFAGPSVEESNDALILVSSGATGAEVLDVADGVARVQLEGGCSSGGSTLTVAAQLVPTLEQFDEIEVVKILDPEGSTNDPDGPEDSTPECLEP